MTINFICDFNPFYTSSAVANRYEGILRGLMQNGIRVNLYVIGGYQSIGEYSGKKLNEFSLLKTKYLVPWLNSNLTLRRINGYLLRRISMALCNAQFKKLLCEPVDYCWIAGGYVIRNFLINNKGINKSKLLIEFSEYQQLYKDDKSLSDRVRNRLEEEFRVTCEFLKYVDSILVITKCLEAYYKTLAPAKVKFMHLPMTVDSSRFSNISKNEKYKTPYIAYTGTYNNAKDGVDILIKAFSKIAHKYPLLHLYLAGFYHYDVGMQKKIIADAGLDERVTYLGSLGKEEIPEFVSNAELLVLSRPDSRQAQGGFPTKLGEYLSTGKPVCVTKVGEIPDYLEDNVSVFMATPGDVDSFADAMNRALSNPEEAKIVGTNGKKVAETNFSTDVQTKRLVEFLKANK